MLFWKFVRLLSNKQQILGLNLRTFSVDDFHASRPPPVVVHDLFAAPSLGSGVVEKATSVTHKESVSLVPLDGAMAS